jgi:diaminohydroxyphosphoribosylaminopyrimidine deaminase/5-amino-6-(5-phosphoribosylamino)uracil reductase
VPLARQAQIDTRWLAAAAALAERARPISRPNPGVGAIIVSGGKVVGRGWTQPGGRPHAEALALEAAGALAEGSTLYVTLEPCAHASPRGPACADLVARSGLARVVVGMADPDPRTAGSGMSRIVRAGIAVHDCRWSAGALGLEGHAARTALRRPHVTLKLALSIDGCIATAAGQSRWITGEASRGHVHRERARADAIVVGGQTLRDDAPRLSVRLAGLEQRAPDRLVLTHGVAPAGWRRLGAPGDIAALEGVHYLFVEGGAGAAAAFLAADLVDRLLIYRAPLVIGGGRPGIGDIGLGDLAAAHGRWRPEDSRQFGPDRLETFSRNRMNSA